jgi:HAE1 family hydrophobic/amphiphilic exporter-1
LPVGTRQEISRDLALDIDKKFREKYPEIKMLSLREGQADSDNTFANMSDNGSHIISGYISLTSVSERKEVCGDL